MTTRDSKVAFVFSALYMGGAEKFGISLANRFAANGIRTYIILFEKIESPCYQLVDENITIFHMGRKSKFDVFFSNKFNRLLKEEQITDVFFFCLNPLLYTRLLGSRPSLNTRFYVTLHSTVPVNRKESIKTWFLLRFTRQSDFVIFICRNQREYHMKKYNYNPKYQTIIYNGVDTVHFNPESLVSAKDIKKEIGIPKNHRVILLVATFRPEKGHSDALKALKILQTRYPQHSNTHLICIGGGKEHYISKLKQQCIQIGLKDFVHFEGIQKDVRPYYELADLFTLTSVSVETFSIAALEAMSYGLPIALTNIGGASEMIFEQQNGILSIAGDPESIAAAWHNLLSEKFSREKIRKIVLEHFSLEKTFASYLKQTTSG